VEYQCCLVLAIGDYTGGELCLVEPGIIIPLRDRNLVVFRSSCITHFNLHYKGTHTSLVLHSDGASIQYREDMSG
ncbi:hypothetical protein BKA93DRAFT_716385, partial [Sparassis latifolia]